jgi:hypothetical protein
MTQNEPPHGSLARRSAIVAAAVAVASISAANALSRMVQNGELAAVLSEIQLRRLAKAAPAAEGRTTTVIRSVGIDGVRTATLPPAAGSRPALMQFRNETK